MVQSATSTKIHKNNHIKTLLDRDIVDIRMDRSKDPWFDLFYSEF